MTNAALKPVANADRVFAWRDHVSLWFSLGVGLLVVQTGAWLVPALGTRQALLAILLGSVIGAGLLAWTARLACSTGLASAGLMHATYGSAFARLPVFLNVIQLIGWTTFELVVMRDGTLAIVEHSLGLASTGLTAEVAATLLWGAVLLGLLAGSMIKLVRRVISRVALPLVVLSLLWLSWQFAQQLSGTGMQAFWHKSGDGSMSFLSATDLVMAMPVSWLPLVSDYARHGKLTHGRGANKAFTGTFLGYLLANVWCYALGVMVVASADPNQTLLQTLLLAQGGLLALGLILFDELDNTYGDVYSGSVSAHSIWPSWSIKRWGLTLACFCILFALLLPMASLEPFLLMLSSVFVPLYGVILGRMSVGRLSQGRLSKGVSSALLMETRRVNPSAAIIWLAGIVLYHLLMQFWPQWGSALPTLAITFVLSWFTQQRGHQAATTAPNA